MPDDKSYVAFAGNRRIAQGDLREAALAVKTVLDRDPWARLVILEAATSQLVELDFRGTPEAVLRRVDERSVTKTVPGEDALPEGERRQPGRPRLGVVAREVTLLPRHWEWLATQPGGASVAIRKMVDQARAANQGKDRRRRAQEVAYRFMSAMAGNEAGFEEATRALFGVNHERFSEMTAHWPTDIREHAQMLAAPVFADEE